LSRTAGKPGKLLWRGSRGPEVLGLQKALGVDGANGYFGPGTMKAVARWQRSKRLPVTGAVDTVTRTRMVTEGVLKR
jgi:peptidoglycan hydrolase-like protein with peptidoglycan-binding domain